MGGGGDDLLNTLEREYDIIEFHFRKFNSVMMWGMYWNRN